MSFIAHVLGLAAAQALKDKTWAQSNIYLDPIDPLDIHAPTICIYAFSSNSEVHNRDLLSATGGQKLRFELFLPAEILVETLTFRNGGGASAVFAGLWRQIEIILLSDLSPWAELFRQLHINITSIDMASEIFENERGHRFPVRVFEWILDPLHDPPIGGQIPAVWQGFLDLLAQENGELSLLHDFYHDLISGTSPVQDWVQIMAALGLTQQGAKAILPDQQTRSGAPSGVSTLDVPAHPSALDPALYSASPV